MDLRSASSSYEFACEYDVFLSFRGIDTRYGFTGYLWKALHDSGIRTFMDDRELMGGDEITPSLFRAIANSRIFIPVFSINYASSSFCLNELVHIIDCFKVKGRLVLPVFYDVDPSHVRHQTESYGKALAEHSVNMERLQNWKMALTQAANLSGYHFNPRNGYEHELIKKIVNYVYDKINRARARLHVVDYPVACKYDVFLSFRGSDTRYGFTGYLCEALSDSGIRTFIDHRELMGGDEITPSLFRAIENTRIFIPVFSINYASSSFCLNELVHIIDCFKVKGRLVLPVFYDVDPSHVRHQTESYGKALAKHSDNMERLQKWKMALNQAANLSGYHFNLGNGYEHELLKKIVNCVSKKINRAPLHVTDYPVGLESRVLKVNSLLGMADGGVCMVGIYGTGGMGKTILARAIYNFIADHFDGLCFLHNVRENSANYCLENLQEKLLSETIGLDIKFGDVNEGIPIIKHRLHRKKVLLILDDVDELKQLQVMAGGLDWFGPGSRVIITTRDKHLLESHGIKTTYKLDVLNGEEALELLKWKTFKNNRVDPSYEYILNRAITYSSGLPLALEILGSDFCGRSIEQWESTLDQYERIPNKCIQKILKVSFDSLEEDEQSVFLDIACCFNGCILEEFEDILCAHHDRCIKYHIGVLVEKSLIKISHSGRVTLHDLIEDMGKEIVRLESPRKPGQRSRLWSHKDIVEVLEENSGTSQIETLYLDFPLFEEDEEEEVIEWKGDELKKMKNLKTLIIKNGCFSNGPKHLPKNLRVLEWPRYPSGGLPSDFCPRKLSICRLRKSCLTTFELHGSSKKFVNMRELNLDYCQCLTQILDVSGLPNLEIFSFQNCWNLNTIHESVGFLNKLKILKANDCSKLWRFPPIKLTSLQVLELSHCNSLKNFPEILGDMENIAHIELFGTSIEQFPFSFQNLTRLHTLQIWGSEIFHTLSWTVAQDHLLLKQNDKLSSMVSSNVRFLHLIECNPSDEFLRIGLPRFANVEILDLSGNNFTILPECIKECRFLWSLVLNDCKHLREIGGIPPNLNRLSALQCESLTSSCRSMLLNQEHHEGGGTRFSLAGSARILEWFEHRSRGSSISFWFRNRIPSIALFIASKSMHNKCHNREFVSLATYLSINGYKYAFGTNGIDLNLEIQPDHTYLYDLQLQDIQLESELDEALSKDDWIHAKVTYRNENEVMTPFPIESGIHVFKQKSSMEEIQFTSPYERQN